MLVTHFMSEAFNAISFTMTSPSHLTATAGLHVRPAKTVISYNYYSIVDMPILVRDVLVPPCAPL